MSGLGQVLGVWWAGHLISNVQEPHLAPETAKSCQEPDAAGWLCFSSTARGDCLTCCRICSPKMVAAAQNTARKTAASFTLRPARKVSYSKLKAVKRIVGEAASGRDSVAKSD